MVNRTENGGYEINGKELTRQEARDLFVFMEHEYNREDVESVIEGEVDKEYLDVSLAEDEAFIETVLNNYEHSKNNDDSWSYMLNSAIYAAKDEFKNDSNKNISKDNQVKE